MFHTLCSSLTVIYNHDSEGYFVSRREKGSINASYRSFKVVCNFIDVLNFYFREYCSRNYVSNEVNYDSLKWSSMIFDDGLPSPRHVHHAAKFFGCVPPESGSTIFQAWWWDVYNPQLTFTQESRQLNQLRMAQIKVRTCLR